MSLALSLSILGVLFLLSAFFSAAETALFSLSKIEKRRVEEIHPHLSYWVKGHLEHPRRTLVTILIGNLLVNTLATALVTLIVLDYWQPKYLTFVLIVFTLALIFFSEIMPKTFAVMLTSISSLREFSPITIPS